MPIEVHLCLGPAERWSMVKCAHDVDLVRAHLDIALGIPLFEGLISKQHPRFQCISKKFRPGVRDLHIASLGIDSTAIAHADDVVEVMLRRPKQCDVVENIGWFVLKDTCCGSYETLQAKYTRLMENIRIMLSENEVN